MSFDDINDLLGAALTIPKDDLTGEWPPLLVLGEQRVVDAQSIGELPREGSSIEDGLAGTVAADRIHRMRGVAEQSDAAK